MKKPNITEGEWRIGNYRPYSQVVQIVDPSKDNDSRPGKRQICRMNDNGNQKANAQAISAVPEMLDALYGMYLSMKAHPDYQTGRNQEFIDYVKTAEKALEKAGCEL